MALPQTFRTFKEISNEINKWNINFYRLSEEVTNAPIVSAYKKGRFEYYKDIAATLSNLEIWLAKALMALILKVRNDCAYLEGVSTNQPRLAGTAIKKIVESIELLREIEKTKGYFGVDNRNLKILRRNSQRTINFLRNMKSRISKAETPPKRDEMRASKSVEYSVQKQMSQRQRAKIIEFSHQQKQRELKKSA